MTSESNSSVLHRLESIGFKPSGRRATSTVASRMAACIQPTKRLAPTLLPEGLGPEAHLVVALCTQHPFARHPQLDSHIDAAVNAQPDAAGNVAEYYRNYKMPCAVNGRRCYPT